MMTLLQQMEWKLNLEAIRTDINQLLNIIGEEADLLINFKNGYIRLEVEDDTETYKDIPSLIEGLSTYGERKCISTE